MNNRKISRNEACPCGSGKKFKRCHGQLDSIYQNKKSESNMTPPPVSIDVMEFQRARQQGLGKPIQTNEDGDGQRTIKVNGQAYTSGDWKNFHSFLIDYLQHAMGIEWSKNQISLPFSEKHEIFVWYDKISQYQPLISESAKEVAEAPMIGGVAAYMHLSYDLYTLAHNAELQSELIRRLQNANTFIGARYEVQVAAMLIRAGFDIEFEDEQDGSTTHCEFTATYKATGKRFSVEAKRMESSRVTRNLGRALSKNANHTRIVFIDLNFSETPGPNKSSPYLQQALRSISKYENSVPYARTLPPAYIFLTNNPWEHSLDEIEKFSLTLCGSFKIDDFKAGYKHASLQASIQSRKAHLEMHELLESILKNYRIPITFDGSDPDSPFSQKRLYIGKRHSFFHDNKQLIEGTITSADVLSQSRTAICGLVTDDNRSFMFLENLTDSEYKAWKRHPETFFGRISDTASDDKGSGLFKWLMNHYKDSDKNLMIENLKDFMDKEELKKLDKDTVLQIFCTRLCDDLDKKANIMLEKSRSI